VWIKQRNKHREAELRRNARTKEIADYMKEMKPAVTNPQHPTADTDLPKLKAKSRRGTQTDVTSASVTDIPPSKEIMYETPKREPFREENDYDVDNYDDEFLEKDAKKFDRESVVP